MSKIKGCDCGKMGHYASKCPEAKRSRNQLMQAHLCGLRESRDDNEEYDEEELELGPVERGRLPGNPGQGVDARTIRGRPHGGGYYSRVALQ